MQKRKLMHLKDRFKTIAGKRMSQNPLKVLVTGARSGLGKHCLEAFSGIAYTRETSFADIEKKAADKPFDLIIHAAFNAKPGIHAQDLNAYLNDTVLLTERMLTLPHQQFVFISSVDVYPNNGQMHYEDEAINVDDVSHLYAVSKLMAESLVNAKAKNPLILRCSAMLGKHAKRNSIIRLLTEDKPHLTLTPASSFNYIQHNDIVDVIRKAQTEQLTGIYNLASSTEITLKDICDRFQRTAEFGQYQYESTHVSNEKIAKLLPNFKKSSLDNIDKFIKEVLQTETVT